MPRGNAAVSRFPGRRRASTYRRGLSTTLIADRSIRDRLTIPSSTHELLSSLNDWLVD